MNAGSKHKQYLFTQDQYTCTKQPNHTQRRTDNRKTHRA